MKLGVHGLSRKGCPIPQFLVRDNRAEQESSTFFLFKADVWKANCGFY